MTEPPEKSATRLEQSFLATASHEIRTPLNGILGTASLLLETDLSPAQREYAEAIRTSGARLLDLVNNVLDAARLDAGAIELEDTVFCPVRLAREITELLAPRAHEKRVDIASRCLALPMPSVRGDVGRVRQILFNLVGNALKFTDEGGVLVDVERDGDSIVYRVIDTGPGIAPHDQERLFSAFAQARAGDARRDGGVGLGLAIASRLAGLLGGTLRVDSTPGFGAAFVLRVPLSAVDGPPSHDLPVLDARVALVGLPEASALSVAAALAATGATPLTYCDTTHVETAGCDVVLVDAGSPPKEISRLAAVTPSLVVLRPQDRGAIPRFRALGCVGWLVRPLRASTLAERVYLAQRREVFSEAAIEAAASGQVVIADDNPVNALIARRTLESAGFAVTVAQTGSDALDCARQVDPVLIIMDLRMPVMDGFEATRRLREAGRDVPVLALSAEVTPEIERAALEAGASQVAAKPIDPDTLRQIALKWVGHRRLGDAA